MDLVTLSRAFGFSFTAGINLYATVAIIGLAERYGWVDLPAQFHVFDNDVVIYGALAMYAIEFLADKIPWIDTVWDTVHTLVRPLGGALIAVAALGEAAPLLQAIIALMGATVAASTHVTKAGSRAAINTSPEPLSNSAMSLAEDGLVIGIGFLTLVVPIVALLVTVALLLLIFVFSRRLYVGAKRRFSSRA